MCRRVLIAMLCSLLVWPAAIGAQSARRAFWYSLLVPGWGQYYAGQPASGRRFLALELGLWGGYFALQHLAGVRRDHYRAFAAAHAGARPKGKGGQYFDDLGFYDSLLQHNQFARRDEAPDPELYPDTPEYFWEWDREESRQRYRDLRNESRSAKRQALYTTSMIMANHLFAAIHAARKAGQGERAVAPSRVEVELSALDAGLGVVLRRRF